MLLSFSNSLVERTHFWTDWKAALIARQVPAYQHEVDDQNYSIYFYDLPEIHVCYIWLTDVPPSLIYNNEYTQEQNDIDLVDWETNYFSGSNVPVNLKISGSAGAFVSNFPLTQSVYVVNEQSVSGTLDVEVLNFPSVQEITGTVSVTGLDSTKSTGHTTTLFTASLVSVQVLAPNPDRLGVSFSYPVISSPGIYGIAYVCVGSVATVSSSVYALMPGPPGLPGTYISPDTLSQEPYSVVFDYPNGFITVTEYT